MLIIFDLDDTLIDTTNSLTPIIYKRVLDILLKKGLKVDDPNEAYLKILEIDKTTLSSRETLKIYLNSIDSNHFYDEATKLMSEIPLKDIKIIPLEHANDILKHLSNNNILAMVTGGKRKFQLTKIKNSGIDTSVFSKIIVTKSDKGRHYKKLIKEMRFSPQDTYVCGDRISIDLAPAKKIGCKTIHMKWGRGLNCKKDENVDFTISSLIKLKNILD